MAKIELIEMIDLIILTFVDSVSHFEPEYIWKHLHVGSF